MEAFAKVLMILIPAIYTLVCIEAIYAYFKGRFNFRAMDTISSLTAGMTNAIKSALGLTVVIVGYNYMFTHMAIIETEVTLLTYFLSLVALDFASYWYHRLAHHVNIFWNRHVIHHSGEDFNIATALRQSVSKFVNISVFFLVPAALMGLPPKVIAIVTPIHLFMQVWYHTTHIGKLGWLEYILVTPSQHRVHHAINPIYMDKNLSGVFCIWDRLFGTFQEELDEEPCVYGITRQVRTWNPIKINVLHLWLLIKDAWRADKIVDKFKIWFMPTGWRPANVEAADPVPYYTPETLVKYETDNSKALIAWSWMQFFVLSFMTFHLFYKIASIGIPQVYIYGVFLYFMVYSYTSLMDRDSTALWLEVAKSVAGLAIIYISGGWFGIDNMIPGGTMGVALYFIISVAVVAHFVFNELRVSHTNQSPYISA